MLLKKAHAIKGWYGLFLYELPARPRDWQDSFSNQYRRGGCTGRAGFYIGHGYAQISADKYKKT
jgi:hypothetical protein